MKQFLYDKLAEFNKSKLNEFQIVLTDYLPKFSNLPETMSTSTRIWGYEDFGFWYCNPYESFLFGIDGSSCILSSIGSKNYYTTCDELHRSPNNEKFRVSTPVEISTITINSENHEFFMPGSVLTYIKFNNPDSKFGINVELDMLLNSIDQDNQRIANYIDFVGWLFSSLRLANKPFPEWVHPSELLTNPVCSFVPILPNFTLPKDLCLSIYLNKLEQYIDNTPQYHRFKFDIIDHARKTWKTALAI